LNESDIYREWEPPAGWRHAVPAVTATAETDAVVARYAAQDARRFS
jgi:hypothetical protein